jgi:hypothetical protein
MPITEKVRIARQFGDRLIPSVALWAIVSANSACSNRLCFLGTSHEDCCYGASVTHFRRKLSTSQIVGKTVRWFWIPDQIYTVALPSESARDRMVNDGETATLSYHCPLSLLHFIHFDRTLSSQVGKLWMWWTQLTGRSMTATRLPIDIRQVRLVWSPLRLAPPNMASSSPRCFIFLCAPIGIVFLPSESAQ